MIDNGEQSAVIHPNILCKYLWILCFCLLIQPFNSICYRFGAFMRLNLEIVRNTVSPCLFFIPNLDKGNLGKLIKRSCRFKASALPKRIMTLFEGTDEVYHFNDLQIPIRVPLLISPFFDSTIPNRDIGNNIRNPLY